MSDTAEAAVHDLVGFMAAFDPQSLQQLQRQHPGEPLLRPGRPLGRLEAPAAVRVALAARGLQALVAQGDALADRLARRIRSSHRIELAAQLVALFGSGGLLALLLGEGSAALQTASAGVALLGSATALAVKFLRRDLAGADNGLVSQHQSLVQAVAQGVQVAARLRPFERTRDDLGDAGTLAALIDEANTLAGQMYRLMKLAGVPVAVGEVLA
jgi:hypothetical protein